MENSNTLSPYHLTSSHPNVSFSHRWGHTPFCLLVMFFIFSHFSAVRPFAHFTGQRTPQIRQHFSLDGNVSIDDGFMITNHFWCVYRHSQIASVEGGRPVFCCLGYVLVTRSSLNVNIVPSWMTREQQSHGHMVAAFSIQGGEQTFPAGHYNMHFHN